jgi:hypothetical protein
MSTVSELGNLRKSKISLRSFEDDKSLAKDEPFFFFSNVATELSVSCLPEQQNPLSRPLLPDSCFFHLIRQR